MNLLTVVVLLLTINFGFAQETYLKITKSDKENDFEMYPPGTKFELKNKHGYIVFKNSNDPGIITIDDAYTLYVYPSWKNDADVFNLKEGKIENVLTSAHSQMPTKAYSIKSNGVSGSYTVTDSKDRKGKKNLQFKLSNGITFLYEDDKYRAYLNEEYNYIRIKGKYLIESELGTLKLSFNPDNGVVWWVFEPKE
ncbi:hypothetical protein Q2T40_12895 [Winogradskyella maritima]|uniref:Lipocalin-like domain-containing protein n=2 Tax=Winogradskyella maritima TaxID=1517766 RepID=A0ABV8AGY2_9FLAO|nr:hypothetical protein [Winogradskyella maritima]